MDQKALRELEHRCIQEEPPWCTAACPLHVDARAFAGYVALGRWQDAWKELRKRMPLAGILGRICDAPCEDRCKRGEAGGAIRIGALERACVQTDPPALAHQSLPAKGKKVAVAGSGLAGLTAAWDLARKGYAVTVFEAREQAGASVPEFDRIPADVIEEEIALLTRLNVGFELGRDPDTKDIADRCLDSFDAVFLGLDAINGRVWDIESDDAGRVRIDDLTCSTSRTGVFAGGQTPSPVLQAAQGRWAAASIDRFLQKVSLTAGREKERPHGTRLFTSLAGVAPIPAAPLKDTTGAYTPEQAQTEARRCLQCECMECVKVCVYLERFGGYPKKYAREVYNNLSIVMGDHKANKLINSCSLCGLCEQVCPNDFAMQDLCLQARRSMVERDKMPPSAHEFALLDMAFSQSGQFALTRHQPDSRTSSHAFFPGCQLCASAPEQVQKVYAHLRTTLTGGVGLILNCCGAPAHWAGRTRAFEEQAAHLKAQWEALGQPRMILACSTCLRMFEDLLPMIPAVSLWTVLENHCPHPQASGMTRPLAVHDPCTTRPHPELQACVRRLLARTGVNIEELFLGSEHTECCGFGGLMQNANPDLARDVIRKRTERSDADYITYCAMCRDHLAAAGKRTVHLLDLFFPDSHQPDPALRPRPLWSRRQENRAWLKATLLERLWNEVLDTMIAQHTIKLVISPEVAELLDQRRILEDDLRQVIRHAETSGDRLFHPSSNRYRAAHTPYKVTFWVEYTPTDEGYVVHNAYAHRMEVIGP